MNHSNSQHKLVSLEEQFWKGDRKFYKENLTKDSFMIFPDPIGILKKDLIVESIATSQRWSRVDFEDIHISNLSEGVVLLVYRAEAMREDGSEYKAYASSIYIMTGDKWKLHFHQQTPNNS